MKNILRTFAVSGLLLVFPLQAPADIFVMPGDLIYKHAKLETTCEKCHTKFDKKAQSGLCADCHKEIGSDVAAQRGFHGRLGAGKECSDCHPDHKGRYALSIFLDKEKFDHTRTDYPLRDAHADPKVKCESCHLTGRKYSEAPSACGECHKKGDKHKGMMGSDCERCHSEKSWKDLAFDHGRTAYKLYGRHSRVPCTQCHVDTRYKETPKLCVSCHTKGDTHKGKLGSRCEDCHTEKGWKEVIFNHDRKSTYPLRFKHQQVRCVSCHVNEKFAGTPRSCNACHQKDDKHKGVFGSKCETCHTESNWSEAVFDHDRRTPYPLRSAHKQAKCAGCHLGDWSKGKLKTTCVSCHQKNDVHKGTYGLKCEDCHNEKDWKEIIFDHDRQTKSPLLGQHKQVKCADCHSSGRFSDKLATLCVKCHEKDDIHEKQFGPICGTCHVEKRWGETHFDHFEETDYRLIGKHKGLNCLDCHPQRLYENEKFRKDCDYCHLKNDVHKGKEGKRCERCHTEMGWKQIIGKKAKK